MERLVNIPETKAKSILLALCSDNSQLKERALQFLQDIDALEHDMTAGDHQKGTKRKAQSAIMICIQCQSPFYEEDNGDRKCKYHNGKLEVDYEGDAWADHDEDCHGTIDTDENRLEYPEGFRWSCCGKVGYRSGCTRGRHDARSGLRGRYGDTPGTWGVTAVESSEESEQSNGDESEDDH
ncbi:hypothetical protein F4803DRAFT_566649 [Xylaria telfairii]|nr:hypothetical protein F4803DRAFT_566649 [Xylaria telfairii]